MGLDMYLNANRYLSDWEPKQTAARAAIKEVLSFDNGDQDIEVKANVMYWRKVNAIHQWFVGNVQEGEDNCREYYVSREQLLELSDLCKEVTNDPAQAAQLLPTTSGCFFGTTDYDDYYFNEVRCTAEHIDELLKDPQYDGCDFSYWSSW